MAHAVVAVECHHRCSSTAGQLVPSVVSVVTTTSPSSSSSSSSSISSSTVSAAVDTITSAQLLNRSTSVTTSACLDEVIQQRQLSTASVAMEPTMTPNAIVTITSVPLNVTTVPTVPVPSIGSNALVVPNITIASIGQSTSQQAHVRPVESMPTKPGMNVSSAKFRTVPGTELDFNRREIGNLDSVTTAFRLRTVESVAIGTADESNVLTTSDGDLSNIIVVETNLDRQSAESMSSDFDPVKDLEWLNGVTTLPGSNLKFRYNEFGVMELITDGDANSFDTASRSMTSDRADFVRSNASTKCKESIVESQLTSVRGSTRKRRRSVALQDDACSPDSLTIGIADKGDAVNVHDSKIHDFHENADSSVSGMQSFNTEETADDVTLDERAMQTDEPSKESPGLSQPAPRMEKRGRPLGSKNVNSNKKFKSTFSWPKYLEQTKSIAAPSKCFKEAFPCSKNGFRVGMKMEAVDPVHQSLFCVVSVAEIRGYRLRLHFDGFSDCYDFWVNADSAEIFKAGWCEKTNHQLQPPKGFTKNEFNWASYLKLSKALSAPKHLFTNKTSNVTYRFPMRCVTPHGFRIGMKLEAVDKKTVFMDRRNSSTSLVCVATISDVMDNRILIHFDGWETIYDYWSDCTSPYIHPVGWCQEKGHVLMPPNKCKDPEHFTWEAYLVRSKSQAAPARAFKQRPASSFKKGMKLEAVDPRNPSLVRVATVSDIGNHQVKLHFDGWAETYDFWLDDESPEIHPVTWCEKSGHPLEPPPSKDYCVMISGQGSGCPTPGCQGIGHIRGPKYTTHHSSFGCPYSHSNLSKDMGIPDRVKTAKEHKTENKKPSADYQKSTSAATCDNVDELLGKYTQHQKSSSSPIESTSPGMGSGGEESVGGEVHSAVESLCKHGRGRRNRKELGEDRHLVGDLRFVSEASSDSNSSLKCDSPSSVNSSLTSTSGPASIASELSSIVHKSIFMPGGNDGRNGVCVGADTSASFRRHAKLLPGLARLRGVDVGRWTVDEVADFVRTLPGCHDVAKAFKDEQIDGEAFVLLNQADIVNLMNIKLGPALKIYNSIVMLHHMTAES